MTYALKTFAAALIGCLLAVAPASAQSAASPNDMARLLAGLAPADGSPFASFAQDRNWQQHAALMNKTWSDLERKQLGPIRVWSQANLTQRRPVTFFFFSGPDFLYVDSFFPDSDVYVLAGLEPTGGLPDVTKIKSGALPGEYGKLRTSMRSILNLSYFITREMDQDLRTSQLRGTLPILYVFMARAGKTIHDVSFVSLDADGTEKADTGDKSAARGVKIIFSGADGKKRTLYYLRTDLSNRRRRLHQGRVLPAARRGLLADARLPARSWRQPCPGRHRHTVALPRGTQVGPASVRRIRRTDPAVQGPLPAQPAAALPPPGRALHRLRRRLPLAA